MNRFLFTLLVLLIADGVLSHLDTSNYDHTIALHDDYKIYWTVRTSSNEIALAFEGKILSKEFMTDPFLSHSAYYGLVRLWHKYVVISIRCP
jgi:hypothetical protein